MEGREEVVVVDLDRDLGQVMVPVLDPGAVKDMVLVVVEEAEAVAEVEVVAAFNFLFSFLNLFSGLFFCSGLLFFPSSGGDGVCFGRYC